MEETRSLGEKENHVVTLHLMYLAMAMASASIPSHEVASQ